MKITKVTYSRLHSFGNYENETVGAEAEVGEEDNAVECLEAVRSWVDTQLLGNKVSRREAGMTQAELQEARRQLVAMNEQAQAYREAGAKLQEALIRDRQQRQPCSEGAGSGVRPVRAGSTAGTAVLMRNTWRSQSPSTDLNH